jgi:hypothetical protein
VYVGSGLIECGLCSKGLSGRPTAPTPMASNGASTRATRAAEGAASRPPMPAVDDELRKFTVRRLSDPRHAAAVAAARAQVRDRLAVV